MTIQLNADKNLTIHAAYENQIIEKLAKELARFSEHITRLEIHLSDENGDKSGIDDKKCLLEARIENRPPFAVSSFGQTYDLAINSSIDKLKSALTTVIGKLKEKQL